jgi:hypothetical protein
MKTINELWDNFTTARGHKKYEILIPITNIFRSKKKKKAKGWEWVYECCDKVGDEGSTSDPYCPEHGGQLTCKDIE